MSKQTCTRKERKIERKEERTNEQKKGKINTRQKYAGNQADRNRGVYKRVYR